MITAATAQPADSASIVLLSIFGGAALTALAGLFGAWLQGRREHKKWVRERRFEAFTAAESVFTQLTFMDVRLTRYSEAGDRKSFDALVREREDFVTKMIGGVLAPLELLGPAAVVEAQMAYIRLDPAAPADTKAAAAEAVTSSMRVALLA